MMFTTAIVAASGLVYLSEAVEQSTVIRGTISTSTAFNKIVKIGAAISMDADDKYASLGGQLWGGWQLWKDWVNLEKGGITVGSEKWGVELIQIEDFSTAASCNLAADALLNNAIYNVDIMFGPYSSGLTSGVMTRTIADGELLISAGSNQASLWETSPVGSWGLLSLNGGYYTDAMTLFKSKGASKVISFCNNDPNGKTCSTSDEDLVTSAVVAAGMTMIDYYALDSTLSTFKSDFLTGLTFAESSDADVVIFNDYSALCVEGISILQDMDWTPDALFLVVCNTDANVVATIGDAAISYATTYTAFAPTATHTSAISGYTPASFETAFEKQFGLKPTYQAAAAFAGGELLVAAMEQQALSNVALVLDTTALSSIFSTGTWDSLQGNGKHFESNHLINSLWYIMQYDTSSSTDIVTSSNIVYPMVSFDERTSSTSCVTNNYYEEEEDEDYAVSLVLTAIFCFLGGIITATALFFVFGYKNKQPMAASSSSSVEMK